MRVLGRTRISRLTEESTSIERQREEIQKWADTHGHEVVGWAEDLDVSGTVDPFKTPGLGPWLEAPKSGSWDIVVAWKLDRISRRSVPTHKLFAWLDEHGKTLVCTAEQIDLSTWTGQLMASVIAGLAQGELEAIRERSRASYVKLKQSGRFAGGSVPYGYVPTKVEAGWNLAIKPDEARVIRWMADELVSGRSAKAVAGQLNAEQVPSPKASRKPGTQWSAQTVLWILKSKTVLGWATFKGSTVRDADNEPVRAADGVLTLTEYKQVQEAIEARKAPHGRAHNAAPLLGVAVCWDCGEPMWANINSSKTIRYYRCSKRCCLAVNAGELEHSVYSLFLEQLGNHRRLEKQVEKAVNHRERITELEMAYQELTESVGRLDNPGIVTVVVQRLEAIDKELSSLRLAQDRSGEVSWIESEETYAEAFNNADTEGKRQLMLKAGITVRAKPLHMHLTIPEDLLERLK